MLALPTPYKKTERRVSGAPFRNRRRFRRLSYCNAIVAAGIELPIEAPVGSKNTVPR
jgi:hypothetical protein